MGSDIALVQDNPLLNQHPAPNHMMLNLPRYKKLSRHAIGYLTGSVASVLSAVGCLIPLQYLVDTAEVVGASLAAAGGVGMVTTAIIMARKSIKLYKPLDKASSIEYKHLKTLVQAHFGAAANGYPSYTDALLSRKNSVSWTWETERTITQYTVKLDQETGLYSFNEERVFDLAATRVGQKTVTTNRTPAPTLPKASIDAVTQLEETITQLEQIPLEVEQQHQLTRLAADLHELTVKHARLAVLDKPAADTKLHEGLGVLRRETEALKEELKHVLTEDLKVYNDYMNSRAGGNLRVGVS